MFGKKRKFTRHHLNYGLNRSSFSGNSKTRPLKRGDPRFRKTKKITILAGILLAGIFLIYLLGFSSYLEVKSITISENAVFNENLDKQVWESISKKYVGKNLLFIDKEELIADISQKFMDLKDIQIDKNYPSTVEVTFQEYPLVANVINESTNLKKSFIINSVGYVIKENLENKSLPYIKIKSDEPFNIKNPIIEEKKLQYILESTSYFQDKFGMNIQEVEYKPIAREVRLLTEKNFYIWMDIQVPYQDQFKKLKKALVKLDIYKESLEYIDLRIAGGSGDKIIYKRK